MLKINLHLLFISILNSTYVWRMSIFSKHKNCEDGQSSDLKDFKWTPFYLHSWDAKVSDTGKKVNWWNKSKLTIKIQQ